MSRPVRVNVTALDIAKGVQRICYRCPIARAVKRATKATDAFAYPDIVCTYKHGKGRSWPTPKVAKAFMSNFDRGAKVKPFSFTLK